MSLFKKLLFKRIRLVALTTCISVFSAIVSLSWNTQLSIIINSINANRSVSGKTVLNTAIIVIISAAAAYLLGLCSGFACETLAHDLRMGYARHFAALSLTEIENLNAGEQLSRLQNEIADISGFFHANLFAVADDLVKFIVTFSWMLRTNPELTLSSNIPTVIVILYTVFSSRVISEAVQRSRQASAKMNGFADTLISIFPVIRLFNAGPFIREQYNEALEEWENASIMAERRRALLMSLSALLSSTPLLLLLLIGGAQVINGTATVGTIYVFINLSGNVSGIMMNMPGRIAMFRRFSADLKRMEPFVSI